MAHLGHNLQLEARMQQLSATLDRLAAAFSENLKRTLNFGRSGEPGAKGPGPEPISDIARAAREECLLFVTREHPLARDLRYAMAALRIEHDYERANELVEAYHERLQVLRNAPFFDICQELTAIGEEILHLATLIRATWQWNAPDDPGLPESIRRTMASIRANLTATQERILDKIADQKGSPAMLAELVLACRHLKRLAVLLESIPEEKTAFDRRAE